MQLITIKNFKRCPALVFTLSRGEIMSSSNNYVSVCSLRLANFCNSFITVHCLIKPCRKQYIKQSDNMIEMDSLAAH